MQWLVADYPVLCHRPTAVAAVVAEKKRVKAEGEKQGVRR
jgi:hypothetical protein